MQRNNPDTTTASLNPAYLKMLEECGTRIQTILFKLDELDQGIFSRFDETDTERERREQLAKLLLTILIVFAIASLTLYIVSYPLQDETAKTWTQRISTTTGIANFPISIAYGSKKSPLSSDTLAWLKFTRRLSNNDMNGFQQLLELAKDLHELMSTLFSNNADWELVLDNLQKNRAHMENYSIATIDSCKIASDSLRKTMRQATHLYTKTDGVSPAWIPVFAKHNSEIIINMDDINERTALIPKRN